MVASVVTKSDLGRGKKHAPAPKIQESVCSVCGAIILVGLSPQEHLCAAHLYCGELKDQKFDPSRPPNF